MMNDLEHSRLQVNDDQDRKYSFEHIDWRFDEATYLRTQELIIQAGALFGDGAGGELGENEEYERGISELICRTCGVPVDQKEQVAAEIHAYARTLQAAAE